jgi:hypothetical protein
VALHGRQFTRIVQAPEVAGIVIHPAMVFTPRDAVERDAIRVVGDERVRWPLVHNEDLAELYVVALERAPAGSPALLPGDSAPGIPNRKSSRPTRLPASSANGRGAVRSTSN